VSAESDLRAAAAELRPVIDVAWSDSVEKLLLDNDRLAAAMDELVDAALSSFEDSLPFTVIEHLRAASAHMYGYLPNRWPELRARFGEHMTAQEMFRQMMRDEIAPALRSLGFKGSGQAYFLPSETHWALLSFQRSQLRSTAERIEFAVNYDVTTTEEWDERRRTRGAPERPSGSWLGLRTIVDRGPHGGGLQHWWELRVGSPVQPLAEDVVTRITNEALPEMQELTERPLG
jgi:hypothetical protein